jgi:hypothetical protein
MSSRPGNAFEEGSLLEVVRERDRQLAVIGLLKAGTVVTHVRIEVLPTDQICHAVAHSTTCGSRK